MLVPQNINDYLIRYQVDWAITMPENCPPSDIEVPHDHNFFRLTYEEDGISERDLKSYAELDLQRNWGDKLPLAVGLSVLDDEDKALKTMKLPYMKGMHGVARMVLQPTSGVVKRTGKHLSHYTWWRTTSFCIQNIQMVQL